MDDLATLIKLLKIDLSKVQSIELFYEIKIERIVPNIKIVFK